jgi:hypothetical protein
VPTGGAGVAAPAWMAIFTTCATFFFGAILESLLGFYFFFFKGRRRTMVSRHFRNEFRKPSTSVRYSTTF